MRPGAGLGRKLLAAVLVPAVLISATAVLGVLAAGYVLEDMLIKQALRDEARHYFDKRRNDSTFPTPDTQNLKGYRTGDLIPVELTQLSPGFHKPRKDSGFTVVYVSEREDERLYLVFNGEQVRDLALYFGLAPLAAVLLVLYIATFLAYRMTNRAVSPVIALAREVSRLSPSKSGNLTLEMTPPAKFDREVSTLHDALDNMVSRVNRYVDRERNFTRDASHELRSPLTVIKMATNMMLSKSDIGEADRVTLQRIKRATNDMEELVEAFLLLARESSQDLMSESVELGAVVLDEAERAASLLQNKPVKYEVNLASRVMVEAPVKVASVLIGNLIRNAFNYTDSGLIKISVAERCLVIDDSGVGMSPEDLTAAFDPFHRASVGSVSGYGVGLTIVKRIADRFSWLVEFKSEKSVGTRVTVTFPQATIVGGGERSDSGQLDKI